MDTALLGARGCGRIPEGKVVQAAHPDQLRFETTVYCRVKKSQAITTECIRHEMWSSLEYVGFRYGKSQRWGENGV
jgi:hypothetical protein